MTFPFSKDNDEKSKSILANIPGFDSVIGWMTKVLQGDAGSFSQVVDWAYGVAINADLPGVSSAQELADEYTDKGKNLEDAVDKLVSDYWVKSGIMGTATGIGGIATLPLNIVSGTVLQLRMAAAIALIGGWRLEDEKVKLALIMCAMGSKVVNKLSTKIVEKAVEKAAAKLAGKFIGKSVPIMGALFSGAVDAATTRGIGKMAKKWFVTEVPQDFTIEAEYIELPEENE